ncbi:MAG: hypothetical protein M1821_009586 [Bathelium mastoideum]|nr:MAG: hypothetical protein M1821_009586 [Bathelium mastoideum]
MAAPGGKYYIQDKLKTPEVHHTSFQQLWETKWKEPCERGLYPFMFGSIKDFEPVAESIIKKGLKEPYDWDEYAQEFFPKAEELVQKAEEAEKAGEKEKASEFYLFPAPRSEKQRHAWEEGKKAARKGLGLREHPVHEVLIPHKHATAGEGAHIPVFHQLPSTASQQHPAPLLLIVTGLDGYRTELAVWCDSWRRLGVATAVVEIPGTGDSPARRGDPTAPDRQWSSVLDWAAAQPGVDSARIGAWCFSTGGYYGIRLAHTHAARLAGVVAQGGGCHHMFDAEWLANANHGEYPFDLASTLGYAFGFGDDLEAFKREGHKFSLLKDGTLDRPECARLLLVNGTEDSIFPIDDYYLALQHGPAKEVRIVAGRPHMGEPEGFFIILPWLYKLFGIEGDAKQQMSQIPSRTKY